MSCAIVTGSGGLVGMAVTELLISKGLEVIGIDNDTRGDLFGGEGSVASGIRHLSSRTAGTHRRYWHEHEDIRNYDGLLRIFNSVRGDIVLVVHAAGQPSHDWSAMSPLTDFAINAVGTLNVLEANRQMGNAPFVYLSTNKVYGDCVNHLGVGHAPSPYVHAREHGLYYPCILEEDTRYDFWGLYYDDDRPDWVEREGVNELAPIDMSMHSPFGVSKAAGDLMVQEYGRYFNMPTACFRCGCLTGGAHRGVPLHGFLAYLAKCIVAKESYTIFGYNGKQVRDNLHAKDLAQAIWLWYKTPGIAQIFNMGGGRENSCSIIEAIQAMDESFVADYEASPRKGDHIWWISDTSKFEALYPEWKREYDLPAIYAELMGVGDDA